MRPLTLSLAVALVAGLARTAFGQEMPGASLGDGAERVFQFFKTPSGHATLVLAAGLVALRVYYAARKAVSVRLDHRLGPPRGLLSGFFARVRLDRLVKAGRFEEAADLLLAYEPTRVLEAAELYIKAKRYSRAAAMLVANNRLRRAAETYVRAGAFDLAAELFEKAEDLTRAEENYLRAGNKLAAARMLAGAGKAERAARYYAEAKRPQEAAEQLEAAGKTREAAELYVEALAILERAGGSERVVHPGERDMGVERMRDRLCEKILSLFEKLGDFESQVGLLVDQERPAEAADVLKRTGRMNDAARLLVEHQLPDLARQVLDESGAGETTRRRVLHGAR